MNDLQQFEQQQVQKQIDRMGEKKIPDFQAGDTVRVNVKIVEKTEKETRHRIQGYEGVCIARGGDGINQSFTVRKISYGEGVERVFPLYSPAIDSIELVRRGSVRRAKLYYLRNLSGKAARITERDTRAEEANKAAQSAINAPEKKAVNA